jgi:transcriptional regulator with XRE-family HTH domain
MNKLYENIKKRRQQLGMTQDDLAKKSGYSDRSMIAKIEKGTVNLSASKIKDIAVALNTTEIKLSGWEEDLRNNADAIYDQYIDAINEGKTVGSMTVHEATLLDAYRESDEQTKEMAERILFYRKGIGGEEK